MIGEIQIIAPLKVGEEVPFGSLWACTYVTMLVLEMTDKNTREYATIQVRKHRTDYVRYTTLEDGMMCWERVW